MYRLEALGELSRDDDFPIGTERGTRAQMALSSTTRSHEEVVVPAVQHLLQWSDLSLSQLGGIAVGIGPGLFTGLRVGVETARTLAQFLRVPLVAISSLDVLAFPLRDARRSVGAVIDARRGEVFFGLYRSTPGGLSRMNESTVCSPDVLVAERAAADYFQTVANGRDAKTAANRFIYADYMNAADDGSIPMMVCLTLDA